jgi:hypothetical protein
VNVLVTLATMTGANCSMTNEPRITSITNIAAPMGAL